MSDREEIIKGLKELRGSVETMNLLSEAIELLKEEAVKPEANEDEWVCGCCGSWLERQRMIGPGAILHDLCDYCPQCGKKVDWKAVDPRD